MTIGHESKKYYRTLDGTLVDIWLSLFSFSIFLQEREGKPHGSFLDPAGRSLEFHAAWSGRNNPFCHPFCPPNLQLLKSNQKSAWHIWHNCSWGGCRSATRSRSSKMKENVTISSTYMLPALSLGPFDLLGCLKLWSAMLFWVLNLLRYKLAIASPARLQETFTTSYHPHCFWRRNQFQLQESSTSSGTLKENKHQKP